MRRTVSGFAGTSPAGSSSDIRTSEVAGEVRRNPTGIIAQDPANRKRIIRYSARLNPEQGVLPFSFSMDEDTPGVAATVPSNLGRRFNALPQTVQAQRSGGILLAARESMSYHKKSDS